MAQGDVAQCGATGEVSPVVVALDRNICFLTGLAEDGAGYAVGAVALVGVELQHHAAVHHRGIGSIGEFRMVGMYRMGVVSGHHKGMAEHFHDIPVTGLADPHQEIFQQVGGSALDGGRANLFAVKDTQHGYG